MANLTIDEAMSLIPKYLDRVAAEAERFMKSEIDRMADKGYATGELRNSINTRIVDENTRGVGTDITRPATKNSPEFNYARAFQKGRRAFSGHPTLHWKDPLAENANKDGWVVARRVSGTPPHDFIKSTIDHIKATHIGLK